MKNSLKKMRAETDLKKKHEYGRALSEQVHSYNNQEEEFLQGDNVSVSAKYITSAEPFTIKGSFLWDDMIYPDLYGTQPTGPVSPADIL